MPARCTTTGNSIPIVSTIMCRFRPNTFLPVTSNWRGRLANARSGPRQRHRRQAHPCEASCFAIPLVRQIAWVCLAFQLILWKHPLSIAAILVFVLPGFIAYRFVLQRRVDPTQRSTSIRLAIRAAYCIGFPMKGPIRRVAKARSIVDLQKT